MEGSAAPTLQNSNLVHRSDFQCGTDDQTEGDRLTNPTVAVPYEEFDRERIHLDEDEVDLMLELPLSISTSPGGSEAEATKPMLLPETPSPHRDLMEVDRLQGQSSDGGYTIPSVYRLVCPTPVLEVAVPRHQSLTI